MCKAYPVNVREFHTLYRYLYFRFDRILCSVPPLSRESRCVKHDSGRSPDLRSFGVVASQNSHYRVPLNLPISCLTVVFQRIIAFDRGRSFTVAGPWRILTALPYSPVFYQFPAPEPFVYSIVICILYHVARFYANIFSNKKI